MKGGGVEYLSKEYCYTRCVERPEAGDNYPIYGEVNVSKWGVNVSEP